MHTFLAIFLLSTFGSIIALVGGLIFLAVPAWSKWLTKISIPFAAGVLLTITLIGLIPETFEILGEEGLMITLGTFIGAYLFEQLLFSLHHHESDHEHGHHLKQAAPLVVIGDTIHNFIDGVAIAASYLVNPGLGVVTAISTFLHEVPHEVGDFGVLLKSGWKKKKVLTVNFISSLATFGGTLLVVTFPPSETFLGTLMAMSAGLFLYLGASDFLPHLDHEEKSWLNIIALVAGVVIMLGVLSAIPHDHEEHSEVEPHQEEISLSVSL